MAFVHAIRSPLLILALAATAAGGTFDLAAYRSLLQRDADLSTEQLLERHAPVGPYLSEVAARPGEVAFLESIDEYYELRDGERELLALHGFMVSERLQYSSFGAALHQIWHADLPVYLSTDLFLHAFHHSFDEILKAVETGTLIPLLEATLVDLRAEWFNLKQQYGDDPRMDASLADVDLHLAVALSLLRGELNPTHLFSSRVLAEELVARANGAQGLGNYALYNETPRTIDFSQFKPRGHYTHGTQLKRYFRAMMWLGRIDFRLSIPPGQGAPGSVQREAVDSFLMRELLEASGRRSEIDRMEGILGAFIGEPDNTTVADLDEMAVELDLSSTADLWDPEDYAHFEELLESERYQPQAINSRILLADPMGGEPLDPPYVFLLFGQRFTVDSNVLGNVVFDRIRYQGGQPFRGLPDPLDVLYCLGNDDVLPLLEPQLDEYHYAANLSALRYLIDAYDEEYWSSSLYTHWLAAIRSLSNTGSIPGAPEFMRTGAWQQQKMQTQLASWAELRHDTILYSKQSYTGGITCSFPHGYVEPVPEFYRSLQRFAEFGSAEIVPKLEGMDAVEVGHYYERAAELMGIVAGIAEQELSGTPLSQEQLTFLQEILFLQPSGCSSAETGWLRELFYGWEETPVSKRDHIVADVHTQPTDAAGNMVGKVLHAATGQPMLGVFVARCSSGELTAFAGPVASYREITTTGFYRLSDEEWEDIVLRGPWQSPTGSRLFAPATESWTHVYLADHLGTRRHDAISILGDETVSNGEGEESGDEPPPSGLGVVRSLHAAPNPFNPRTVIALELDGRQPTHVRLQLVNVRGERVAVLIDEPLPPGNYLAPWDGTDHSGRPVASGVYLAQVMAGGRVLTTKLALVR